MRCLLWSRTISMIKGREPGLFAVERRGRSFLENIFIFIFFIVIYFFMLFPYPLHLFDGLLDVGDTYFNIWTLTWNTHALTSDPVNLFNTNILYPEQNTLAYSENQYATSLVFAPIYLITKNPIFSYNVVFLLTFVLSGFNTYLLVKYLTKNRAAAILSGLFFAFFPARYLQTFHIQILATQWMPLAILFAVKFVSEKRIKYLSLFVLFLSLTVLSSFYLGFQIVTILIIFFGVYLIYERKKIEAKKIFQLLFSIILVFIILAPFIWPYLQVQSEMDGFSRSEQENILYSAELSTYLTVNSSNILYGKIINNLPHIALKTGRGFFPGVLILIFSIASLLRFRSVGGDNREVKEEFIKIVFLFILIFSVIMTLGPVLKWRGQPTGISLPYKLFFEYFPGFKSMRVPSRFVFTAMFSLAVLSGYGFRNFFEAIRKAKESVLGEIIMFIVLGTILLLESLSVPFEVKEARVLDNIPEVYKWLNTTPPDSTIWDFSNDRRRNNYYSTYNWRNLLNGESGFFSSNFLDLSRISEILSDKKSVDVLKATGVDYIVLHKVYPDQELETILNLLAQDEDISLEKEFDEAVVYRNNKVKTPKIFIASYPFYIGGGVEKIEMLNSFPKIEKNSALFYSFYKVNRDNLIYENTIKPIEVRISGMEEYRALYFPNKSCEISSPNEIFYLNVFVKNLGSKVWYQSGTNQINLSYHIEDEDTGTVMVFDGLRTGLSKDVVPGDGEKVKLRILSPDTPGNYVILVDLVEELITWFSGQGVEPLRIPLSVGTSSEECRRGAHSDYRGSKEPMFEEPRLIDISPFSYRFEILTRGQYLIWIDRSPLESPEVLTVLIDGSEISVEKRETNTGQVYYSVENLELGEGEHVVGVEEGDRFFAARRNFGNATIDNIIKTNDRKYKVKVRAEAPFFIVFDEPFRNYWTLTVDGEKVENHYAANFYRNAWYIQKTGDLDIDISYDYRWLYLFVLSNFLLISLVVLSVLPFRRFLP